MARAGKMQTSGCGRYIMSAEVWKPIADFPSYEISNRGNVRRRFAVRGKCPKILRPWYVRGCYAAVALRRGGKTYKRLVHRLVGAAFFGLLKNQELDHRRMRPATRRQIVHGACGTVHSSKYKGVSRCHGGWLACIQVDGRTRWLGVFRSERTSATVYDRAALAAWGPDAFLNFPRGQ
jgi:hypothetical protein